MQQTNCHPFRYGKWLWMHNGLIDDWFTVKRDLMLADRPGAVPADRGARPTRRCSSSSPSRSVSRTIRRVRWSEPSASSRRSASGTASSTRSRARSRRPTASGSGRSATRARASRARSYFSTSYDTLKRSTPTIRVSRTSTRRPGSSSRSRSATCSASGTRFRRQAGASSQPGQDEIKHVPAGRAGHCLTRPTRRVLRRASALTLVAPPRPRGTLASGDARGAVDDPGLAAGESDGTPTRVLSGFSLARALDTDACSRR